MLLLHAGLGGRAVAGGLMVDRMICLAVVASLAVAFGSPWRCQCGARSSSLVAPTRSRLLAMRETIACTFG